MTDRYGSWSAHHGSGFASVALCSQSGFRSSTCRPPSRTRTSSRWGRTRSWIRCGVLRMTLVHDGCEASRLEKLEDIPWRTGSSSSPQGVLGKPRRSVRLWIV